MGKVAHHVRLVVQEAPWNAWRHGGAKSAKVTMQSTENGLVIMVSDDGWGFDPGSLDQTGLGFWGGDSCNPFHSTRGIWNSGLRGSKR